MKSPRRHLPRPRHFFPLLLVAAASILPTCTSPNGEKAAPAPPPHILIILADDLGTGDLSGANPASKIPTPHLDRLAGEGMRFTDAHSPSAVCTPTRYGLLTGRYAWRTRLKSGVLWGQSPLLIDPARETIASLLHRRGYHTGAIGKWHLGFGTRGEVDYTQPLRPGPRELGFDTFFGIPASLDMPPYVYVRDDAPEQAPTGTVEGSTARRQNGGGFWRAGPCAPDFRHEEVLPRLATEAIAFLEEHAANRADEPFFLYLPLTAPHTPWLPLEEFRGRSEAGHYGDFVVQVDDVVGRVLATLERTGLADDTLVFFTSDNGSHWPESDVRRWGHHANLDHRGQKADIFEGGHRVPLLVRWPGRVAPGTVSAETIGLTDLFATVASIVGATLGPEAGVDSEDFSAVLRGRETTGPIREAIVHHSFDGMFAIRQGRWKLVLGLGSGGFTAPARVTPGPGDPPGQLYDLEADPGETHNRWAESPAIVARLRGLLERYQAQGHSHRAGL